VLGEGAMGVVYEAWDTSLDRAVAVKVVHAIHAADPDIHARFREEPRSAARVVHENLTHVYFVGTTDGRPFYAMELVEGRTLERLVATEGPQPIERAVDILVQIAAGLGAVHAAGLVHRDVKPGNVLVTADGRVKLTDFGLSKSLDAATGGTEAGSIIGTPDFMSPEQCRGEPIDARTDVYALGLVAFVLLTGTKPWKGSSLGALLDQQMNAPLPRVTAIRPELPADVDEVLALLTAKDRARRPATMAQAAVLIERLRPRVVVPAPVVARGTALLIDLTVFGLLSAGGATALRWIGRHVGLPDVWALADGFVALALALVLLPGMERRFGASVGKLLLRLEVVRADGTTPDLWTLVRRLFARLPFFPFLVVPDEWLPSWGLAVVNFGTLAWLLAGAVVHLVTHGKTLSDLLTRTRVTYAAARR
jgi:uncharacterized RDD family membrane protein YckC